ncbi:MAG: hypothetical protein PHD83_03040 [Caldisericia bacterium]|nr:hypothetical protein [Caldisericia bacterium]
MEQHAAKLVTEWKAWFAWFFLLTGGAMLFTQWKDAETFWPYILASILLISGLVSITDYLLYATYRSLFMGVLLSMISLFIWIHLFLYPTIPFWENAFWLSFMFVAIGVSYFLFILETGEKGFAWIAFLCIGISLVQWLLQAQWKQDMQWISYLAISLVLAGFLLIGLNRTGSKIE